MPDVDASVPEPEISDSGSSKPATSKPKFGEALNLDGDGDIYTVIEAGSEIWVSRRVGDLVEKRKISNEEYQKAAKNPLPNNVKSRKPPKGITLGSYIEDQSGQPRRVSGYDAESGELLFDSDEGGQWIEYSSGSDAGSRRSLDRTPQATQRSGSKKTRGGPVEEGNSIVEDFVADNLKKATFDLVDLTKQKKKDSGPDKEPDKIAVKESEETEEVKRDQESSSGGSSEYIEEPDEIIEEQGKNIPPAVVIAPIIAVGGATPSVRSGKKISTPVPESTLLSASRASSAPAPASVSVPVPSSGKQKKAASSVQSIREMREQLRSDMEAVHKGLGTSAASTLQKNSAVIAPLVAGKQVGAAMLNAIAAEPRPDAARGQEQQLLFAHAANALDVLGARVADRRRSIQELQAQADGLRQNIAALNAQASPEKTGAYRQADIGSRLQAGTTQLGDVQNRLALARHQVQSDEGRMQQLRIGINLMKNAAPEVMQGQVPRAIVGLIQQSIPTDIPKPSPEKLAAYAATLDSRDALPATRVTEQAADSSPAPRSYALPPISHVRRKRESFISPMADGGSHLREQLQKKGLTLPASTAVAMVSAQGSDRVSQSRPVIDTIPASYADADTESETGKDYFEGDQGARSRFARQQKGLSETQEQFLSGSTDTTSEPGLGNEGMREQHIRQSEEQSPNEDMLRAAAMDAEMQRARALAFEAMQSGGAQDAQANQASRMKFMKQAEAARRNVSRLVDLFDTAHGLEDVVGLIGVIVNMNMRLFTGLFIKNPRSITRKFFPPAQFPIEMAGIVSIDFILAVCIFIALLPLFIFMAIMVVLLLGAGGTVTAIVNAAASQ